MLIFPIFEQMLPSPMNKCCLTLTVLLTTLISLNSTAQERSNFRSFQIPLSKTIEITSDQEDPDVRILKKVLPKPHPGTDRQNAELVKASLEKYRKSAFIPESGEKQQAAVAPAMYRNFGGKQFQRICSQR